MMALVKVSRQYIVTICGKHLSAYSIDSEKFIQCSVPESSDAYGKTRCRNKDSDSSIVAAEFDLSGNFFSACTDCKQLLVWTVEDDWKLYSRRLLPRRPTALAFTICGNFVIIADKTGDVHRFSALPDQELSELQTVGNSLLLGHVSMLLDVKLCAGDQFLVTCDRDEKIRVSCYPNAYNIHNYCLGHTEYVTRLCYFADDDLLASASGDGTVKLWDYRCGRILDDVDCCPYIDLGEDTTVDCNRDDVSGSHDGAKDIRCLTSSHRSLAVSFHGHCDLLLFSIVAGDSSSWRLAFQHRLAMSAAIWDIAFLTQWQLLVLQASENLPAVVCTLSLTDSSRVTMVASTDDEKTSSLVARINSNAQLFHSVIDEPSIFQVLHKARIDNMQDYVEKKRLRLARKQKEQKDEIQSTGDDTVMAKRHKVSADN